MEQQGRARNQEVRRELYLQQKANDPNSTQCIQYEAGAKKDEQRAIRAFHRKEPYSIHHQLSTADPVKQSRPDLHLCVKRFPGSCAQTP